MNKLDEFAEYVQGKFTEFINVLEEELEVPRATIVTILARKEFQELSQDVSSNSPLKSPSGSTCESNGCIAMIKSGVRRGQECGKKISLQSESKNYCGTHLKHETLGAVREKEAEAIDGFIFRLNDKGRYVFGDTGLILKSVDDKKIIGKQLPDGSVADLTEEDIALCKRRKLRFIESYSMQHVAATATEAKGCDTLQHTAKIKL